ncbi:hypothetical protein GO013_07260 [Pseudodesulfovibrio sp. JC047]|uniref:hypothetical protein n=1 Tax=Pseudodesulfovibrio sp. JC047 TaxID=2683199 RepID=UPI0013D66293|nr:hypothetical protein [Pseudodesulfovibrio sp. JC047]NDV19216.1 hypothetical protein [Pseudodesulfovibrio sp. JC047]
MTLELGKYTAQGQQASQGFRAHELDKSGVQHLSNALQSIAQSMSDNRVRNDVETARVQLESGIVELDEKYKVDTDLDTLAERRSQDVKALVDGIKGGIHHRASDFLTNDFERTMQRDARHTRAFIDKRDGEMRLATMPEGMDVRMNKAIQAADGEKYQAARKELEGYVTSFQPFMSEGAFAKTWNSTMDAVDYKRSLRMVQGMAERGEVFNPEPFMHLSPNQAASVEATYRAAVREQERTVAQRQIDRGTVLLPRLQDSLASAMETGIPMDGTETMLAELATLGEQGAAKAALLQSQFNRTARVADSLNAVKNKPFSDQFAMVETLKPEPGSDGYVADMEMYRSAGQMVQQRYTAFQADQAGFVRKDAENRARAAADPWVKDEDLEPFVVQASMALQRELGAVEPKVLTSAQAKGLKDQYERANGDGKAKMLQQISAYGEYSRQALAELDLGLGHTFMAEVYMDDPVTGRKVLDIASMKMSDIVVDPVEKKSITKDVSDAYFGGPGDVFMQLYRVTGNPKYTRMNQELYDMTLKMGLADGDGTGVMDQLWGRFETVADENVLIFTPAEMDADDVADKLREMSRRLPPEMEAYRNGVWKNSEDGKGFSLVLPLGGGVMHRDGKPVVVTYDELDMIDSLDVHVGTIASGKKDWEIH